MSVFMLVCFIIYESPKFKILALQKCRYNVNFKKSYIFIKGLLD